MVQEYIIFQNVVGLYMRLIKIMEGAEEFCKNIEIFIK
ncbi:hypothetical protein CLH_2139 [Clostridium botulinum E3 str. Alaska E43]|nr:hypothetical protein CLH_2139 [Clostridium botulinum E3 str. Alaska E43]